MRESQMQPWTPEAIAELDAHVKRTMTEAATAYAKLLELGQEPLDYAIQLRTTNGMTAEVTTRGFPTELPEKPALPKGQSA